MDVLFSENDEWMIDSLIKVHEKGFTTYGFVIKGLS